MEDKYFELLKQLAKQSAPKKAINESFVGNTTANLTYVPDVKHTDVYNPVELPEYRLYPNDESIDEDIIEDYDDLERLLRNPKISTQEVFDLVYKILVDEDVELGDDKALKLVALALDRFFEDLTIDHIYPVNRPYQLFFAIYRYFFVTYAIERLALAILMMYIAQHKNYRSIYLEPFKSLTLNNQKVENALLGAFRFIPVEDVIDISKEDQFHEYYIRFMKKLANEPDLLQYLGIDPKDYEILLPYLIEDDNTIDSIYRNILNLEVGEFCKYSCIAMLTGAIENEPSNS